MKTMTDFSNIKAIIFDFDDTLGNREIYAYETYYRLLKETIDISDAIELEAIMQDLMIWDEQGNIVKSHITDMLKNKYDFSLPMHNFSSWWNDEQWKASVPFSDTKQTLAELKKKYILGIITNGDSVAQRNKIQQAGLSSFFSADHIIVSGDYGYAKPDIRIFKQAAKALCLETSACCYVGDIFSNDVLGAYRSGMVPIWIWTHGARMCKADITKIEKISDLLKIL